MKILSLQPAENIINIAGEVSKCLLCWDNVKLPSLLSAHGLYEGSAVWLGHFDDIFR
jgi:hypothetical protein